MEIQFIGLPGSGKTTIIKSLSKGNNSFVNNDLKTKFLVYLKLLLIYMLITKKFPWFRSMILEKIKIKEEYFNKNLNNYFNLNLKIISRLNCSFTQKNLLTSRLISSVNDWIIGQSLNTHFKIYDDHFSQNIVSLYGLRGFNRDMKKYVEATPKPDLIVVLNACPNLCIDRMSQRKRGLPLILRRMNNNELQNALTRSKHIISELIDIYKEMSIRVCIIEEKDTIEDSLRKIKDELA
jgi:thymidylate kinase